MGFCTKARPAIKKLINLIDDNMVKYADAALKVTTAIRTALNSNVAISITELTKTNADNLMRHWLASSLDRAIVILTLTKECNQFEDQDERFKCYFEALKKLPATQQKTQLMRLAQMMVADMDQRQYDQHIYDSVTQLQYTANKL